MMSEANAKNSAYMMSICIFMIFLILTTPVYTAFALSVSNTTIETTITKADVRFQTDYDADSQLTYTVEGVNRTSNVGFSQTMHSVPIEGLAPATNYPYTIWAKATNGSDDTATKSGTFTTKGTLRSGNATTPQPANQTGDGSNGGSTPPEGYLLPPVITIDDLDLETSESEAVISGTANQPVSIGLYINYTRTATIYEAGVIEYEAGNFTILAPLDEGDNIILLEITGADEKPLYRSQTVYVDTEPPVIIEHNLAELSPAYTSVVEVTGRVSEPNIPIRIYVDEDQSGFAACSDGKDNDGDGRIDYLNDPGCGSPDDASEQDSTIPSACNNNIDDDKDGKTDFLQDPGCDSQSDNSEVDFVSEETECNDGEDNDNDGEIDFLRDDGCTSLSDDSENSDESSDFVSTRSDANGYFKKEISLSGGFLSLFEGMGIDNIPNVQSAVAVNRDQFGNEQAAGVSFSTVGSHSVRIVATDRVGQYDEASGQIQQVSCSQGGGDWAVSVDDVYPLSILPDHIFEGLGMITFNVDVEYVGTGNPDSARITHGTVRQQQRSIADRRDTFSPEAILTGSRCKFYPAVDFTDKSHVVCPLNKWPPGADKNITAAYERLEEHGTLIFPLQLELQYSYREGDEKTGNIVSGTHKECADISVFVDKRISPDVLPNKLINSTVELIDDAIEGIDSIMKPLNTVKMATTYACLATSLVGIFQAAGEVSSCLTEGIKIDQQRAIEQYLRGAKAGDEQNLESVCPTSEDGTKGGCTDCAAAIASRISSEKTQQQLCDRIFCPVIPTATEYIKQVNEKGTLRDVSACARDGYYGGGFAGGDTTVVTYNSDDNFKKTVGCGKEYDDKWNTACSLNTDVIPESKKLLEPKEAKSNRSASLGDFLNLVGQCKGPETNKSDDNFFRQNGNIYVQEDNDPRCTKMGEDRSSGKTDSKGNYDASAETNKITTATVPVDKLTKGGYSECVETLPNGRLVYKQKSGGDIVEYNPKDTDNTDFIQVGDSKDHVQVTRYPRYEKNNGVLKTYAVNATTKELYESPTGVLTKPVAEGEKYVGKDAKGNTYTGTATVTKDEAGKDIETVTWSEQDPKEQAYVTKNTNSKDGTGSYGMSNNPSDKDGVPGPKELQSQDVRAVLKDPTSSFLQSLQCICLPAIEGYLIVIRNVLTAIKNCFESVLVTGEFKAGTCRAILTQYLCDWIYNLISCILGASETLSNKTVNVGERATGGILGSLSQLSAGSKKTTSAMQTRYGDTATFSALFNKRKLIHAVCLAAFGFDWQPELDMATSIKGGGFSLQSTGFVAPATRRFVSYNPLDGGRATFMYHTGFTLVAGSDLNYQVDLICSQNNSCSSKEGFLGGRCDCSYQGNDAKNGASEVVYRIATGSANGGDVVGDNDVGDSTGNEYDLITQDIRYDTVRLSWTDTSARQDNDDNTVATRPKNGATSTQIKTIGGSPPSTCTFSLLTFRFACDYQAYGENGDVFFVGEKATLRLRDGQDTFKNGDKFGVTVFAQQDFAGVDIGDQIGKFARVELKREGSSTVIERYESHNSASSLFATNNPIPLVTSYVFGQGDTKKGAGAGFKPIKSGDVAGGTSFIRVTDIETDDKKNFVDSGKSRHYIKIGKGTECKYLRVGIDSSDDKVLSKDELENLWASSTSGCAIGEYEFTTGSEKNKFYSATIIRNLPNIKVGLIKESATVGAISYFDVTLPVSSSSSGSPLGLCANTAKESLVAEVSLLHGRLRNQDGSNVPGNWIPGTISTYRGDVQKHSIPFELICSGYTGKVEPTEEELAEYGQCEKRLYTKGEVNTKCICVATHQRIDAATLASSSAGLYCKGDDLHDVCVADGKATGVCACLNSEKKIGNMCSSNDICGVSGDCFPAPVGPTATELALARTEKIAETVKRLEAGLRAKGFTEIQTHSGASGTTEIIGDPTRAKTYLEILNISTSEVSDQITTVHHSDLIFSTLYPE